MEIQAVGKYITGALVALLAFSFEGEAHAQASDYKMMMAFESHCAKCHTPTPAERVPSRETLRAMPVSKVYNSLTKGKMVPMAEGLSDAQKKGVAEWLTGHPLTALNLSAKGMKNQCPVGATLHDALSGPRWTSWGVDPTSNRRFQPAEMARLSSEQVSHLKPKWVFGIPAGATIRGQPIVAGGWLWVNSDAGVTYALDAKSGCVHWSLVTKQPVLSSIALGKTPGTSDRYTLYFGDMGANVYAVDAQTGKVSWQVRVDEHIAANISGSVTLDGQDRLIVPIGSWEEVTSDNPTYNCCTFQGSVAALDTRSGKVIWKNHTIQIPVRKLWTRSDGVENFGPAGSGIWVAPTIDTARRTIYVGTSNSYSPVDDGNASDAIIAFSLDTGKRLGMYELNARDWNAQACGTKKEDQEKFCSGLPKGTNHDIPAATIIHSLTDGRQVLIVSDEARKMAALDPDNFSKPLWEKMAYEDGGTISAGNLGMADDGRVILVPIATQGPDPGAPASAGEGRVQRLGKDGGLLGLDPATGATLWRTNVGPSDQCSKHTTITNACSGAIQGSVTAIPGVAFAGSVDGTLRAYSTSDGAVLWKFETMRDFDTINGVKARGGTIGPSPTIVDGMVYAGSGYTLMGNQPGNALIAFGPE